MIVKELFARLGLDIDEVAFDKGEAAIAGLRKGFLAFGGAVVAGLAVGAAAIAKTTADAGDAARKLAQKTGVGLEALQELQYAAELADVSADELAVGLQRLAKSGVKDVRAEVLKLSDRFKSMPDDGRKVQLAMEKFGKSGAKLIPLLNGGRKELEKLMAEAHDLGVVFSEEDAAASEEFNDELTRLSKAFVGIRNTIGLALLKPLTKMVTAFKDFLVTIRKYKPDMQKLIQWAKAAAFVIGGVLLAALIANAGAIATTVAWYVALGIAAVIAAVKAAAAWIAAAAPFVFLATAMALVLAVLEDIYMFFTDGESVIGDFAKSIEQFGGWPQFFRDIWAGIVQAFKEGVGKAVLLLDDLASKIPGGRAALGAIAVNSLQGAAMIDSGFNSLFGSGASPGASVGASVNTPGVKVNAPQFKANMTIQTTPGMSVEEVAGATTSALDSWWMSKLGASNAGLEE